MQVSGLDTYMLGWCSPLYCDKADESVYYILGWSRVDLKYKEKISYESAQLTGIVVQPYGTYVKRWIPTQN